MPALIYLRFLVQTKPILKSRDIELTRVSDCTLNARYNYNVPFALSKDIAGGRAEPAIS